MAKIKKKTKAKKAARKRVTAPLSYDPGKGRPQEYLAYLNEHEMAALRRMNGNNMERGPGGLPSFPPDDAIGSGQDVGGSVSVGSGTDTAWQGGTDTGNSAGSGVGGSAGGDSGSFGDGGDSGSGIGGGFGDGGDSGGASVGAGISSGPQGGVVSQSNAATPDIKGITAAAGPSGGITGLNGGSAESLFKQTERSYRDSGISGIGDGRISSIKTQARDELGAMPSSIGPNSYGWAATGPNRLSAYQNANIYGGTLARQGEKFTQDQYDTLLNANTITDTNLNEGVNSLSPVMRQNAAILGSAARFSNLPTGTAIKMGAVETNLGTLRDRPGSQYTGLTQMGDGEFGAYADEDSTALGKTNPWASAQAGTAYMSDLSDKYTDRYGRQPTAGDVYGMYNQGFGGYTSLRANPNALARNVVGADAVRGNLHDNRYSARSITAGQFASQVAALPDRRYNQLTGRAETDLAQTEADLRDMVEADKAVTPPTISSTPGGISTLGIPDRGRINNVPGGVSVSRIPDIGRLNNVPGGVEDNVLRRTGDGTVTSVYDVRVPASGTFTQPYDKAYKIGDLQNLPTNPTGGLDTIPTPDSTDLAGQMFRTNASGTFTSPFDGTDSIPDMGRVLNVPGGTISSMVAGDPRVNMPPGAIQNSIEVRETENDMEPATQETWLDRAMNQNIDIGGIIKNGAQQYAAVQPSVRDYYNAKTGFGSSITGPLADRAAMEALKGPTEQAIRSIGDAAKNALVGSLNAHVAATRYGLAPSLSAQGEQQAAETIERAEGDKLGVKAPLDASVMDPSDERLTTSGNTLKVGADGRYTIAEPSAGGITLTDRDVNTTIAYQPGTENYNKLTEKYDTRGGVRSLDDEESAGVEATVLADDVYRYPTIDGVPVQPDQIDPLDMERMRARRRGEQYLTDKEKAAIKYGGTAARVATSNGIVKVLTGVGDKVATMAYGKTPLHGIANPKDVMRDYYSSPTWEREQIQRVADGYNQRQADLGGENYVGPRGERERTYRYDDMGIGKVGEVADSMKVRRGGESKVSTLGTPDQTAIIHAQWANGINIPNPNDPEYPAYIAWRNSERAAANDDWGWGENSEDSWG